MTEYTIGIDTSKTHLDAFRLEDHRADDGLQGVPFRRRHHRQDRNRAHDPEG